MYDILMDTPYNDIVAILKEPVRGKKRAVSDREDLCEKFYPDWEKGRKDQR